MDKTDIKVWENLSWKELLTPRPPLRELEEGESERRIQRIHSTIAAAESAFTTYPGLATDPLVVDAVAYLLEMDRYADLYNEAVLDLNRRGFESVMSVYGYQGNGYDVSVESFFYWINHENRYVGLNRQYEESHGIGISKSDPHRETVSEVRIRLGEACSWVCCYCTRSGDRNVDPDGRTWHVDHLYAQANGGDSAPDNLVLACAACNISKSKKLIAEFLTWIKERVTQNATT